MQLLASSVVFGSQGYNLQDALGDLHHHIYVTVFNVVFQHRHLLAVKCPPFSLLPWVFTFLTPDLTSGNGPWLLMLMHTLGCVVISKQR